MQNPFTWTVIPGLTRNLGIYELDSRWSLPRIYYGAGMTAW
jgi:hypothetical protein